jgi:copper resistance protein D
MGSLYLASVTVHVLAALLWLGGMFFLAAVGAPVLRKVEPPALRARLFEELGRQFRLVGWLAIVTLLVTGTINLHFRGMLQWQLLSSEAFWATRYGQSLAWKLVLVAIMITVSAVHDFIDGPRASRLSPGTPAALRARRRASWLARLNAVAGVVVVIVAVRLARGG